MNDLMSHSRAVSSAPVPVSESLLATILFDPVRMNALQSFAEMMAKGIVAVPKHLQGKPADCMAIVLQAYQWRMNPYAVAQKTHITQSGALGYEAQLINAVIVNSGALADRPEYEWLGDWDKILGRVEERQGQNGGKFYVATWKRDEEAGLGVIVTARIAGEREPRSVRVMMSQAFPRFSTQWATDPQQQLTYLSLRKFARRYVPDAILGVYTAEELAEAANDDEVLDPLVPTQPRGPQRKSDKPLPMVDEVLREQPARQPAQTVDQATGEITSAPAPAPAAPSAAAGSGGPVNQITPNQVTYLRKKLQTSGLPEEAICQRFHVASIELLSVEQFDELKSELLQSA